MGCHALLRGVFPTHELSLGISHCRRILCWPGCVGSPRVARGVPCSVLMAWWSNCVDGAPFITHLPAMAFGLSPL